MNRRELIMGVGALALTATIPNTTTDLRRVEKLVFGTTSLDGPRWVQVRMKDLRKGNIFRLYDTNRQVGALWMVNEPPSCNNGVWGVVAAPYDLTQDVTLLEKA